MPQQAVVLRDGFSYVFKLEAGNKVICAKVATGRRLGERVEILAGLKAGEEVVASGAAFSPRAMYVAAAATPPAPTTAASSKQGS